MLKSVKTFIKNIRNAGEVLINGKGIRIQAGDSIVINGNQIQVGGQTVTEDGPVIRIEVTGDVGSIDGVGNVTVTGNVTGDIDMSTGDIDVGGDVGGDVDCYCGNVTVKGSIGGDVDCSCGNVRIGK